MITNKYNWIDVKEIYNCTTLNYRKVKVFYSEIKKFFFTQTKATSICNMIQSVFYILSKSLSDLISSILLCKISATYVFSRVAVTSFSILVFVNLSIFLPSFCQIFRNDLWTQGSFAIVLFIIGRYSSGNSVLSIVSHLSSSWNHVKYL